MFVVLKDSIYSIAHNLCYKQHRDRFQSLAFNAIEMKELCIVERILVCKQRNIKFSSECAIDILCQFTGTNICIRQLNIIISIVRLKIEML